MTHPRLDEATKLDRGPGWVLTIRPHCGEAVLSRPTSRDPDAEPGQPDPERAGLEAARRAGQQIRRLVTEHKLTRMWTLTFREQTTADERPMVVRRVQQLTRRLRARLPALKWLAVLEWHPGGHGWHVHMVVDRFVSNRLVSDLWGWGFVDTRLIKVKGDGSSRAATSRAASYVAKYVSKEPAEGAPAHVSGDHRYLRPLGMGVTEIQAEGWFDELLAVAWGWWPEGIGWCWHSSELEGWKGPRTMVLRSG